MVTYTPAPPRHDTGTARTSSGYLHQIDLMRVGTFLFVIAAHTITQTNQPGDGIVTEGLTMLTHFTRNSFLALTGFVLMYQLARQADRGHGDGRAWYMSFWVKRIRAVLFPFLVWSLVYWIYTMVVFGRGGQIFSHFSEYLDQIRWGTAGYGYQLYFLFVIAQVYLLFPLVYEFLRYTRGHHTAVLALALTGQVGILYAMNTVTSSNELWQHLGVTFVPYLFFVILGAIAAEHRAAIADAIRGRGLIIGGALLAATVATVLLYLRHATDTSPAAASTPFTLWLFPFIVNAVIALYAAAHCWAENRSRTPRFNRVVSYAANRSFGVFLVHVLVLNLILTHNTATELQPRWLDTLGDPWSTLLVYVVTIAATVPIVEVLVRLPGAQYLVGRPRLRRTPAPTQPVLAPAAHS